MITAGVIAVTMALPVRTESVADICSTKTSTVRAVSARLKRDIYRRDGVPGGNHTGICSGPQGCELDHVINLSLGGDNSAANLKVQPYDGACNARQKDRLENRLHRLVCAGELQPRDAQSMIYTDWKSAYKKYIDPKGCE